MKISISKRHTKSHGRETIANPIAHFASRVYNITRENLSFPLPTIDQNKKGRQSMFIKSKLFKKIVSLSAAAVVFLSVGTGILHSSGGSFVAYAAESDFEISTSGMLTKYTGSGGRIVIPVSVTSIGAKAFYGNKNVTSVTVPDSVLSIGESAFEGCVSLQSVTMGQSVKTIDTAAFSGCKSLTSVALPEVLISLGVRSFSGCGLTAVKIPDFVETVESNAFSGCKQLASITVSDGNKAYKSHEGVLYDAGMTTLLRCPEGKTGGLSLPDTVTKINRYAFDGCNGLTNVVLPDSLTAINDYAFWFCKGMKRIKIPDSVTKIGDYAFTSCTSLESVEIPDSVTSIGVDAFRYCDSLSKVKISHSVKKILSRTFSNNPVLEEVTLPDSLESIGPYAFYGCPKLKNLRLPDSLTSIESNAFEYCVKLTDLVLPRNLTNIGGSAFSHCTGLLCATVPKTVTVIGWQAFSNCNKLQNIYFEGTQQQWTDINGNNAGLPVGAIIHLNTDLSDIECKITSQPSGQTVRLGDSVTLSLKASGVGLNYQWYFKKAGAASFSQWTGRTRASETVTPNVSWDGIQLYCVVKDYSGKTVQSDTVSITVMQDLTITRQPVSQTVNPGTAVTISLKAQGNSVTYQWYYKKSGADLWSIWNGRTHASETVTPNNTWNGIQLYCKVKDGSGKTIDSDTVKITLSGLISITRQPKDMTVDPGNPLTVSLQAEGAGLTYQWYYLKSGQTSWNVWNGRTHASETVTPNATWDGIQLYCAITDKSGHSVNSNIIRITLVEKVTVKLMPETLAVSSGAVVTFSVKAEGDTTYQWYYRKSGQTSWNLWKGHTTSSTTAQANSTWNGMRVCCIVTDNKGNSTTYNAPSIIIK